ncbi:hypothetical protein [Pararhizobium sp. DWP1-1-3]|uniref:hypothetical protein n=1 Tax=Pararhizobium sp. DWP1-1-3 TaxID=2804652 RepID=UPI003CF95386
MANEFAKWEVAEQETIADILMEMGNKAKGALKPPTDSEVEAMLDAEGNASLQPYCKAYR